VDVTANYPMVKCRSKSSGAVLSGRARAVGEYEDDPGGVCGSRRSRARCGVGPVVAAKNCSTAPVGGREPLQETSER